jgi:hypothetical protein
MSNLYGYHASYTGPVRAGGSGGGEYRTDPTSEGYWQKGCL